MAGFDFEADRAETHAKYLADKQKAIDDEILKKKLLQWASKNAEVQAEVV